MGSRGLSDCFDLIDPAAAAEVLLCRRQLVRTVDAAVTAFNALCSLTALHTTVDVNMSTYVIFDLYDAAADG